MKTKMAIVTTVLLGACSHQASVPMVSGDVLAAPGAQEPGKFAVEVQTGGWNLSASIIGNGCATHSYAADLNPAWNQMMREAMRASVGQVEFETGVVKSAMLTEKGYRGSFLLTQSNATTQVGVAPSMFSATAIAVTHLDAVLVATWPNGKSQQYAVTGRGWALGSSGLLCEDVGKVVASAGSDAVQELARKASLLAKLVSAQENENINRAEFR